MRRRMLVVLALLIVLVAACGGDEESVFSTGAGGATTTPTGGTTTAGDTADLEDLVASQLVTSESPFDEEAADCVAAGVVDEIGYDRLVSLGAGDPDVAFGDVFSRMTEEEVDILAELALDCLDMHALFVEQFIAAGLPEEMAICIADGVAGAPFLHDMLVDAMLEGTVDPMSDPEAVTIITNLVTQCMGS